MKTPLYSKLIEYSQSKLAFHMPGHKFGSVAGLDQINMAQLDNTEAIGMDNLYEADGIIKDAMNLMADFYGSRESIFLTNGATTGILASILATCKEGDQLIVARNAHHSVWSALILAGISPIYISPEYLKEEDMLGEITAYTVEEAFKQYPEAKGILIVSPTYEGVVSDIEAIADVAHRYNRLLIVDEAHGAHFVLENGFPVSAVRKGADLVINSMHKTLPALTQSALLHICSERVSYESIISALRMVQTSSPSYVMMGLMDYIRGYIMEHKEEIIESYITSLIRFRQDLKNQLDVLTLIEFLPVERYDISKVIISTVHANINGYQLAETLNDKFNIAVEAALDNYIILMTTMADQEETLDKLKEALISIDSQLQIQSRRESINSFITEKISLGLNPRKIFYSPKEWIPLEECLNQVVAKNIMLYPPGIPIVAIGEQIKASDIKFINEFKDKLQGIKIVDENILVEIMR